MVRRRVLVVSPHFPPANGADSHRVRATIPYFEENGWDVEVLCVEPRCLAVPKDEWLLCGVPDHVDVHRVNALSLYWSWVPGLGTLDFRARREMHRVGNRILASKLFDLIYFSTTIFGLTVLGAKWKRRFGTPFVVDYQDPWYTDYYRVQNLRPPGGRLKYGIVECLARWQEPRVIEACSGVTAVSPDFPRQLAARYQAAVHLPSLVAPFPGAARDFERIGGEARASMFDSSNGLVHWVYVGVAGPFMRTAIAALFRAIAEERVSQSGFVGRLRLHFIGTSYAPAGKGVASVIPLAKEFGIEDIVEEQTDRIPYSDTLRYLKDSDALLLPGADDEAYAASKLIPYLMARKPTLAILHSRSPAAQRAAEIGGAALATFNQATSASELTGKIRQVWFASGGMSTVMPVNQHQIDLYTDRGQARLLCRFFDQVVDRPL